jgi:hypothetical protein
VRFASAFLFLLATDSALCSDYGVVGLLDTPTARMGKDAELRATVAFDKLHKSYMLTYQATPWLEATFRYTGFNDFFFWDRNYEVKALVVSEREIFPAIAVGARDVVGTGVFGSEYVVASKRFGSLDVSAGMGWGRLAGRGVLSNPLSQLADRFDIRPDTSGLGGEFNLDSFFSGPQVGFFGGVEYQFDDWPLAAVVEYNPDQYDVNVIRGRKPSLRPQSPWSFGLKWEPVAGIELAFSQQHLEDFGLSVSAAIDTSFMPEKQKSRAFRSVSDLDVDALPVQINPGRWYDRLLFDVERSGLLLVAGRIADDGLSAQLVVGNTDYVLWVDALKQHLALADLHLPPSVRRIYFVLEDGGHRPMTVKVDRPSSLSNGELDLSRTVDFLPARELQQPYNDTSYVTGKVNFSINLANRLQLFDPDDPARYQVYLDIGMDYNITNSLVLRGRYGLDIENNFGESRRKESDSVIPKVRSDIVKYLTQGDSGLDALFLDYRSSLGRDIHARAYAGVLEEMYSGAGFEVLYWPFQSRLGVGLSGNWVKQRDFEKSFRHRDYETITGFASLYWATPFYNFDAGVHVGRYLAKDQGATLEVRKTFANGWQVGVWATLTDVPFEQFGEGSFDKGFYFQIPLDGLLGDRTRAKYATRVRPIQRDGGQRLEDFSGNIFWDMRQARIDSISNHIKRLNDE